MQLIGAAVVAVGTAFVLTVREAIVHIAHASRRALAGFAIVGLAIWATGFGCGLTRSSGAATGVASVQREARVTAAPQPSLPTPAPTISAATLTPTPSPPPATTPAPSSPTASIAPTSPPSAVPTAVAPSTLLPDVSGYSKADPLYGSTSALVAYRGPWPAGVIDMQTGVFLQADAAAAMSWTSRTFASWPTNRNTVDIGGTTARAGYASNMGSYVLLFTYGRAAFQLEMGFTLSSSTSQRLAAATAAHAFARSFYAGLTGSQPPP